MKVAAIVGATMAAIITEVMRLLASEEPRLFSIGDTESPVVKIGIPVDISGVLTNSPVDTGITPVVTALVVTEFVVKTRKLHFLKIVPEVETSPEVNWPVVKSGTHPTRASQVLVASLQHSERLQGMA